MTEHDDVSARGYPHIDGRDMDCRVCVIDDDWIQLCKDEMEAIGAASQQLLYDAMATDWFKADSERPKEVRQAELDRRRAELYKEHLDAAGIEIRRKEQR